ncbi:MAG: DNA adenine methylase [Bacteroidales bacterium]|nr:DNA adenine methylase [Bacteroidales bacterium]
MKTAKPFIKWAGGKSQLLSEIRSKYPTTIEKYCEPFVGGGAVLFDVLSNFTPKEVLINDINAELINTYRQIKANCEPLISQLSDLQDKYKSLSDKQRKALFFEKRERFNSLKINGNANENLEKAALFIFINKTCFNGLYRVNSKGLFNVPFNNAKNPLLCDEENLRACSEVLQNVEMTVGDYSICKDFIDKNTFVYIDPPYRPLTQTSAFTSYSENGFSDEQQIELGKFIDSISKKGVYFVANNSDPKNTNQDDNFFDDLYTKYLIERISASRAINSNGSKRGKISELLITNVSKASEFELTAEDLFHLPEYQEIFSEQIGDPNVDKFAKTKITKDLAKTKNYKPGYFYHAVGGTGESGVGEGLYLGKDSKALFNFYNGEGEFGENVITYYGFPHFIDLSRIDDFDSFENEAIKEFGKDNKKSYFQKLALAKGYDGIRYYDICATGEEFVLYNTDKVKQISKKVKKQSLEWW